jgi:hypothetical protein
MVAPGACFEVQTVHSDVPTTGSGRSIYSCDICRPVQKLSWKLTSWSRIRMLDIYRSGGVVEQLSLLGVHRNRSQDIRTFQVE